MKHILGGIAAVLALVAAAPVVASTSWSFTTSTTCTHPGCSNVASNAAVGLGTGAGTASLTAAGWSNTNGSGPNPDTYLLETAYQTSVFGSSGLGIYNKDGCALAGAATNCDNAEGTSPEHSTDNNQRYDMMLLTFSKQVSLRQVTIGWFQTDSDISVLAFSAVGNPGNGNVLNDGSLATKSWSTLTGWTAIGSYSNVGVVNGSPSLNTPTDINANKLYSSQWLVGAYNPIADPANAGWTTGNDYVKLKTFGGCVFGDTTSTGCTNPPSGQVPEPGSLALLGLALAGMVSLRRRKNS